MPSIQLPLLWDSADLCVVLQDVYNDYIMIRRFIWQAIELEAYR